MTSLRDLAVAYSAEFEPEPPPRILKTDAETRLAAKNRREELAAEGLCINGRTHGKATHGVRCKRCYDVHKGGEPPVRSVPTHCRKGHEYNEKTLVIRRTGARDCRACRRARDRARILGLDRPSLPR